MIKHHVLRLAMLCFVVAVAAFPVFAQSPNTASMVVTVVDQTGAVIPGANVSVVNTATGATRESISGDEGTATIAGLPLTGDYTVSVTMTGFTADDVLGIFNARLI